MSVLYRYSLDGNFLTEETIGFETLQTTIKRDRNLKAILKSQDVTLQFRLSGYDYLWNKYWNESWCTEVSLEIQRSFDGNIWTLFYKGIIFTKLIKFDRWKRLAKTKVEDNSYYARIQSNKSQECLPHVALSRNETDITAYVPPTLEIKFFDPVTCLDSAATGKGYKVYDIFKFLIAFMTDAEVEFDSTLFGSGGEWENVLITYGLVVAQVNFGTLDKATFDRNFPKITFEKFLKEMNRLFNLGFYVDNTGSKPKIWIEKYDDLFASNVIHTCDKVIDLSTSTIVELLYSKLKIGTTNTMIQGAFPHDITFLGFRIEDFNIVGDCNVDRTLDLTGDYVVDTNVFQDCLGSNANAYDKEIFVVNCEGISAGPYPAIKTNTLTGTTPPCYYNQAFANDQVAVRYLKHVPNAIFQLLGNVDNKFQATKTALQTLVSTGAPNLIYETLPVIFQDDFSPPNFDTFSNYNPANGRYTIAQSGIYSFFVSTRLTIYYTISDIITGGALNLELYFRVFVTLEEYLTTDTPGVDPPVNSYTIFDNIVLTIPSTINPKNPSGSVTANSTATNFFVVKVRVESLLDLSPLPVNYAITSIIYPNSIYACTNSVTSGGQFTSYDPDYYSVILHQFKDKVSEREFDNIDLNNKSKIEVGIYQELLEQGWIEEIKMNHLEGQADIALNASKNITQNGS